jgi:hypothetical protein
MLLRKFLPVFCFATIRLLFSSYAQSQDQDDPKQLEAFVRSLFDTVKTGKPSEVIDLNKKTFLADPDGWFKKVFGDESGGKLNDEYASLLKIMKSEDFVKELHLVLDSGRSQIVVSKIVAAGDPEHYQDQILSAMLVKPEIYEVRLIKPGSPGEFFDLGFFTYIDGAFRNIGNLKAVRK